jgi:hypothetical protein
MACFFPTTWFIPIEMQPVTLFFLTNQRPALEEVLDQNAVHVKMMMSILLLNTSMPFIELEPKLKKVAFSAELDEAGMQFVFPENHIDTIRNGRVIHDFVSMERMLISGFSAWAANPAGDIQPSLGIKINNFGGFFGAGTIISLLALAAFQ